MISALKPSAEISEDQLKTLESNMIAWYSNPPSNYYSIADEGKDFTRRDLYPYQCDLLDHIKPTESVCEFGCGSALLGAAIVQKQGNYTGIDWSEELIVSNRVRLPSAKFFKVTELPQRMYDLVFSQYVIEHVVDPKAHLSQMWERVRPGGLLAVICPDFINCRSLPNSVYYGTTPARLSHKLRLGRYWDAIAHLLDHQINSKKWITRANALPPGAFWINLTPRVLHEDSYDIDSDAVHLPRFEDISQWISEKGGRILSSSRMMPQVPIEIARFNMYLLAVKPTEDEVAQ
jgi:SAM-dependent methyltransferase